MKKILSVMAALLILSIPLFTNAATYRLGAKSINFNQDASTTKTTDYTITSSDSLVNVTCSSANITITLPTISSLYPGSKAYKILKTDSTTYAVVVTPATGDTIGGESTRYIRGQNDYIVISTGPNNNWSVDFESPYTAEDYEAGTVTLPNITVNNTISGKTVTATGSGATAGVFGNGTTIEIKPNGTIVAEGDTADASENTISFTDPTSDRSTVFPDAGGTVMLSSLATNGADAANAVTGASNALVFEGATANAFETSLTPTDATADRTVTIPDATGTIALTTGTGSFVNVSTIIDTMAVTAADAGTSFLCGTDAIQWNLPPTQAGMIFTFTNSGAAGNNDIEINPDDADQIFGTVTLAASVVAVAGAAGESIINTKGTSIRGDSITLIGDGVDGWYILSSTGIWAEATP